MAVGYDRSGPRHPASAVGSQAAARQAGWHPGTDDTRRHPQLPTRRRAQRNRRTIERSLCRAEASSRQALDTFPKKIAPLELLTGVADRREMKQEDCATGV